MIEDFDVEDLFHPLYYNIPGIPYYNFYFGEGFNDRRVKGCDCTNTCIEGYIPISTLSYLIHEHFNHENGITS